MLCFYVEDPAKGILTDGWGVVTRYGDNEDGFSFNVRPSHATTKTTASVLSVHAKIWATRIFRDFLIARHQAESIR